MANIHPLPFAKVRCLAHMHQKAHNTLLLREGRVGTLEIMLVGSESLGE